MQQDAVISDGWGCKQLLLERRMEKHAKVCVWPCLKRDCVMKQVLLVGLLS